MEIVETSRLNIEFAKNHNEASNVGVRCVEGLPPTVHCQCTATSIPFRDVYGNAFGLAHPILGAEGLQDFKPSDTRGHLSLQEKD
jgi:hypothetical protein